MGVTRHPLCSTRTTRELGPVPVDEGLVRRLEASFLLLRPRGDELVNRFYANLFQQQPTVRPLFPADMTAQRKKFLDMLESIVTTLRDPQTARAQLEALGARHVGYRAREEHYPLVTQALLSAMAQVGGPAWSEEASRDWSDAMRLVCEIMIDGARGATKSGPAKPA